MILVDEAGTVCFGTPLDRWPNEHGKLVAFNVAALFEAPKVEREPVRPYDFDEAQACVRAARTDRFGAPYITTLALGLRRGEALGLLWGDADLDGPPYGCVTPSSDRRAKDSCSCPPRAAPASGPLSPDYVSNGFPGFLESHKLRRARFHDLRHSCASPLFAQGASMRLVMEILGHSQFALAMNTYTHLLPEADRQAASAMDALFGDET